MFSKFVRVLALGWVLYLVGLYIAYPPFWSRMDDVGNLVYAQEQWPGRSMWDVVKTQTLEEKRGPGLFRPVYPAYCYLFYSTFKNHPSLAYGSLFVFLLAVFWAWAHFFERYAFPSKGGENKFILFVLCLAFTPHINLFIHASLLEKWHVVAGVVAFFIVAKFLESVRRTAPERFAWTPTAATLAGLYLTLAFSLLAKPNGLFLLGPICFWLLIEFLRERRREYLTVLTAIVVVAVPAALFFYSIRGNYTSTYSLSAAPGLLLHPSKRTIVYVAAALLALSACFIRFRKAEAFLWPITVISFIVIMAPHPNGTAGYYIAPAGVHIAACVVVAMLGFGAYMKPAVMQLGTVLVLTAATAAAAPVWHERIATQHSLKDLAEWVNKTVAADGRKEPFIFIPTPCVETSGSITYFSRQPGSVKMVWDHTPLTASREKPIYMIASRECPPRPMAGFTFTEPIWVRGEWEIYVNP